MDHAQSTDQPGKLGQEIGRLEEALRREPGHHRHCYELAQCYSEAGKKEKAAELYGRRAAMSGGDGEEAWHARLEEARCLRDIGDEQGFVRQALAAYNLRPWRAEPLYDLARHYRQKGMNAAGVVFAEAGLAVKGPRGDSLSVEDFVYKYGLLEEYSIVANYAREPARKARGFVACDRLALSRDCPGRSRNLARHNLFYYLKPAAEEMPSFAARPIGFTPPDGFHPSNPSVARMGDAIVVNQRAVNVTLTEDGKYETPGGVPEQARNFLLRLTGDLEVTSATEILPPADLPPPKFSRILGFQDARPFVWRGQLWCVAAVRELNEHARYEQVLARIDIPSSRLADWRVLRPEGAQEHEKNWMPRIVDDELQFIYLCDPTRVLSADAVTLSESTPNIWAKEFRGGSQAIPFGEDWLALVHEVAWRDGRRFYQHRFVTFSHEGCITGVSRPFFFQKKGIEFAAGLAWHPDGSRLLVSYGVDDRESWIATVAADEVQRFVGPVEASAPAAPPRQPGEADGGIKGWAASPPNVPQVCEPPPAPAAAAGIGGSGADLPRPSRKRRSSEKTIGLCMIVKNEAHVIERCLNSVRDLIDYALVEDTGSTDGTQQVVREWLKREGIEGKVIQEPWRNFAYNRNLVLSAMRKRRDIDYALVIDADDFVVPHEGFDPSAFKAGLDKDLYSVEVRRAPVSFQMTHLVRNKKEFAYRGVLHEVIVGPRKGHTSGLATGFHISYSQEGARGQDPDKYRKDALVLEDALKSERDPWQRSRYMFYLAQSWLGAGEQRKALEAYTKRTVMGHWPQEIYWSYLRIAHLQEALGYPLDEVLASLEKASRTVTDRAEALHAAAVRCRTNGRYQQAYALATRGLALKPPTESLFHEPWVYDYGLLDEYAISAYWVGHYQESLEACDRLLQEGKCPTEMTERILQNRDYAAEKLAAQAKTAAPGPTV